MNPYPTGAIYIDEKGDTGLIEVEQSWSLDPPNGRLTEDDRRTIAEEMIRRWAKWGGLTIGDAIQALGARMYNPMPGHEPQTFDPVVKLVNSDHVEP